MSVTSRMRELFSRTKRSAQLSTSVVQHEVIDDIVLEELRRDSHRFDAALNARPTLKLGQEDDGTPIEREYDIAPDLYGDLFHSHYTSGDRVHVKDGDDVRSSHELHRRIMDAYVNHDEFLKTRPYTANDDLSAMLATMAAQHVMDEELASTLKEHAERAADMAQWEQQSEQAEDELQDLRERAMREKGEQGAVSQHVLDGITAAGERKREARAQLQQAIEEQDQASLGSAVGPAIDKAVTQARETADAWCSIPGTAVGDKSRLSPEQAFELAAAWRDNDRLRKIAQVIGRFERDFRFQRANRVQGGRDEVVGVELGNDLELMLPTEAMKLGHPMLKLQWQRQYLERSLLQYEMVGIEESGMGPIVCAVDRSGSMSSGAGLRSVFAAAIGLSLLAVAQREKRDFAALDFEHGVTQEYLFPRRGAIDTDAVTRFASAPARGGGTDITAALRRASEIIMGAPDFKSADIILLSDGDDTWADDDEQLCTELAAKGVRVHGIVINEKSKTTHYTEQVSKLTGGVSVAVSDLSLDKPSDATSRLAAGIT